MDEGRVPLLKVDGVAVRFGGLTAISDLSFSVSKGEIVSLIGPNGAGKTTAFNVVTGFLKPTAGLLYYKGRCLNGLRVHEIAALGVVRTFQKTCLFLACTTLENVLIGLHRKGKSSLWKILLNLPDVIVETQTMRERAGQILEFVGLVDRADQFAGALAYGEQRLLGLAIALAAEPSLLLLDEPVSGMNATETSNFVRLLNSVRSNGTTLLLVEHDMRMVMEISDRVIVLNQGKIIANGAAAEIQQHPEVIEAYLGRGRHRA
jgi:branched-chain amino acid transport system ATP-binding protein